MSSVFLHCPRSLFDFPIIDAQKYLHNLLLVDFRLPFFSLYLSFLIFCCGAEHGCSLSPDLDTRARCRLPIAERAFFRPCFVSVSSPPISPSAVGSTCSKYHRCASRPPSVFLPPRVVHPQSVFTSRIFFENVRPLTWKD